MYFDSERKAGSAGRTVLFPLPSVNDAPRRIFPGPFLQQARGDGWFLSHKNLCGLKEWEIRPHSSGLNCTTELCQCVLGDPCAHKCFESFKIPQNRSDLLQRPCSSLCRNFPPRLNMPMQQLKNNSIPDVLGKSRNFLVLNTK